MLTSGLNLEGNKLILLKLLEVALFLQFGRAHLIKANHLTSRRRMDVQALSNMLKMIDRLSEMR